ncbi:uncharacterized protein [Nicotiana tomentosiformis]|uniref:uncharacterized protein n=1 Tax=Nicotiana tomentosiformis TaxID=4098 RepID=UPI00388CCDBE
MKLSISEELFEGWDIHFPDYVRSTLNKLHIHLNPNGVDKPVWTTDNKGNFSVASAWNLFRNKKNKNWVDSMTWHKLVPFKMNFTVRRALRDKLPTDARVSRMGITTPFRCCCCRIPGTEDVEHLFCSRVFLKKCGKSLMGPLGIPYTNISYRQLMINWWNKKVLNPISVLFPGVKLHYNWDSLSQLLNYNISFKKALFLRWIKPPISFVKVNSDGSYKNGVCGGGVVIRDCDGHLIFTYSLVLGPGTSNWAEAVALLFVIKWCRNNRFDKIIANSDSKLLVDCVNGYSGTPWRILKEVEKLKVHKEQAGFLLDHCFREINQVADKLPSMSYTFSQSHIFQNFAELPRQVKGLMAVDRWNLPTFRTSNKKRTDIIFQPP